MPCLSVSSVNCPSVSLAVLQDKIITYNFNNVDHALLPGCSTWDDKVFDPTVGCELMASAGIEYDTDPAAGPRCAASMLHLI